MTITTKAGFRHLMLMRNRERDKRQDTFARGMEGKANLSQRYFFLPSNLSNKAQFQYFVPRQDASIFHTPHHLA